MVWTLDSRNASRRSSLPKKFVLTSFKKKPKGMKEEEQALLDRQALGVVRLTLSQNVAFNITKTNIVVGLMEALSSMYEKLSTSNKIHLMRRLFNLRMKAGALKTHHLNELNTITTQLSTLGIKFDDEVRTLILISSLPKSWNVVVTAMNSSSGGNKLKLDDAYDPILTKEIQRRELGEVSISFVLYSQLRGRNLEKKFKQKKWL